MSLLYSTLELNLPATETELNDVILLFEYPPIILHITSEYIVYHEP